MRRVLTAVWNQVDVLARTDRYPENVRVFVNEKTPPAVHTSILIDVAMLSSTSSTWTTLIREATLLPTGGTVGAVVGGEVGSTIGGGRGGGGWRSARWSKHVWAEILQKRPHDIRSRAVTFYN